MKKRYSVKYSDIVSCENLFSAWEEFVKGKHKKMDVQIFQLHLADNILALHGDLKNKTYKHGRYTHFTITDPKRRDIHKASVRDRLLHHAVHRQLYPFFDQLFISDVYSARVDKDTHRAMNKFREYAYKASKNHTRTCWVLKCDVRKFFASVDHNVLMKVLRRHIRDPDLLWLLENIIRSFHTDLGKGLPLGNLTSQLMANIYINEFDQFVKHKLKAKYYVRYADDFLFVSHDRNQLQECVRYIVHFLHKKLLLELHPRKIHIKTLASGVDFLGWIHFPDHRVLRTATKKRMIRNIGARPTEEAIVSYLGLLGYGNALKLKWRVYNEYILGKNRVCQQSNIYDKRNNSF